MDFSHSLTLSFKAFRSGTYMQNVHWNRLANSARMLYIKLRGEHTPKGEVEKNYLVCYSTFRKKETSCKEIK